MDHTLKDKHIGCFITPKKKEVLKWDRFVELAREKNIHVHDLDLPGPVYPEKLDLVITKFNSELNAISRDPDPKSIQLIKNYNDYVGKYPSVIQLDPIECQDKLTTRPKMLELFNQLCDKVKQLHVPKSMVLSEGDSLPDDFPFPAICKTLEATGARESHDMSIIWDVDALVKMKRPTFVQQFINHNSTIFKVYVIGSYSYVERRPSVHNFHQCQSSVNIRFNSQDFKSLQGKPTASLPPDHLIDSIIKHLSTDLGLTLIGLDMITCSNTGLHYIIDANYFPGYAGDENCPQRFLDLIEAKLNSVSQ